MSGLTLLTGSVDEITVNRREALRYLGYRGQRTDDGIDALFDRAQAELKTCAAPKACFAQYALTMDGDCLQFGELRLQSASLAKNLQDCRSLFLFAATLGAGVDRLLLRFQKTEPAFALVFDAYCSAAVEGWCNLVNEKLAAGRTLRPRFSPGYGDVPLAVQPQILSMLDATRKLGITLTDTLFMTPCKSVTAFVGIEGQGPRA